MTASIAEVVGRGRGGREVADRARSRDVGRPRIEASLWYLGTAPGKPVSDVFRPPGGAVPDTAADDRRTVSIRDARLMASSLSVDAQGFELWDAPSAVEDFLDEHQLSRLYDMETADLALLATGGRRAVVFDRLVRRREPGRALSSLGARRGGGLAGPAGRVHVDYSEASGARRHGLVLPGREPAGRFCIVNVWRSIGPAPVLDTPLAVCDARTVEPVDLVARELRYPDRTGEIYLVRHASRHAWCYFSEMRRHEALVFKQYDSERSGVARFVAHAAFDLPGAPVDAPPRQSIEARVLVTFE